MKKFTVVLSFVLMMLLVMPVNVSASDSTYGVTIDETPWTSSNPKVLQVYSVAKTNKAGYVYIMLKPVKNVANIQIIYPFDAFEKVSEEKQGNNVVVLMKTKDGKAINGTKTELFTAIADFTGDTSDPTAGCVIEYAPLKTECLEIGNKYYDNNGKEVTEAEFNEACGEGNPVVPEDKPNDEENPQTGSVIPYVAVGGGLLAVAGVYLYSRKTSKFYKI